jgi:Asp-tRNA(Asn)/Glu-tRNA(Gln) amidotransferase A subunit family amidase
MVIAGPDPHDPYTRDQPAPRVTFGDLKGIRIGVYRDWFSDASSDVVAPCQQLLEAFVRAGALLVDVIIPDLHLMAVAHGLTIHAEMAANMERYDGSRRREFGLTTRLMLANVRSARSTDYVQAQRMRTRAIIHFRSALDHADVIATPTTPITAPEISPQAVLDQEADIARTIEVMRFVNPAN